METSGQPEATKRTRLESTAHPQELRGDALRPKQDQDRQRSCVAPCQEDVRGCGSRSPCHPLKCKRDDIPLRCPFVALVTPGASDEQ
eukprot:3604993-Prorocentrum_lima.AAC.1